MSDIFTEVDEEVRREQLKKLWARYGHYIVALAFLVVAAVGGWRGYDYWLNQKSAEAGTAFEAAATLADQGKSEEAQAAFQRIAEQGTAGYAALARLREAGELAKRDAQGAVAIFDRLAVDPRLEPMLQDLSALRAGLLLVDTAPFDEMRRRMEPLAGPSGVFRHSARELVALSAWKNGDQAGLQHWSTMIAADAETPAAIRSRVEVLNSVTAAAPKS